LSERKGEERGEEKKGDTRFQVVVFWNENPGSRFVRTDSKKKGGKKKGKRKKKGKKTTDLKRVIEHGRRPMGHLSGGERRKEKTEKGKGKKGEKWTLPKNKSYR